MRKRKQPDYDPRTMILFSDLAEKLGIPWIPFRTQVQKLGIPARYCSKKGSGRGAPKHRFVTIDEAKLIEQEHTYIAYDTEKHVLLADLCRNLGRKDSPTVARHATNFGIPRRYCWVEGVSGTQRFFYLEEARKIRDFMMPIRGELDEYVATYTIAREHHSSGCHISDLVKRHSIPHHLACVPGVTGNRSMMIHKNDVPRVLSFLTPLFNPETQYLMQDFEERFNLRGFQLREILKKVGCQKSYVRRLGKGSQFLAINLEDVHVVENAIKERNREEFFYLISLNPLWESGYITLGRTHDIDQRMDFYRVSDPEMKIRGFWRVPRLNENTVIKFAVQNSNIVKRYTPEKFWVRNWISVYDRVVESLGEPLNYDWIGKKNKFERSGGYVEHA